MGRRRNSNLKSCSKPSFTMPGNKWTHSELIIVLHFASRGFNYRSCAALLQHKVGVEDRTPRGIGVKLRILKERHPELQREARVWILDHVDTYIRDYNMPNLDGLLYFGATELELVSKVLKAVHTQEFIN
jgi:hypothetical protein